MSCKSSVRYTRPFACLGIAKAKGALEAGCGGMSAANPGSLWLFVCILAALTLMPFPAVFAQRQEMIATEDVVVRFDRNLRGVAQTVIDSYAGIRKELEDTFRWRIRFVPTVVLVEKNSDFKRIAGSDLFVALALPARRQMIVDIPRMNIRPFSLGITLKHELCHLLLHHYIDDRRLPRWLDEGVCQWVSDGVSEILRGPDHAVLTDAALAANRIPFGRLQTQFPGDRKALLTAYDQSRSLVAYIGKVYGGERITDILHRMGEGAGVETAISKSLSITLDELERRWHGQLRKGARWFSYISAHLYGILFFLGALMTILGFLRYWKRKKGYRDDDEEDCWL